MSLTLEELKAKNAEEEANSTAHPQVVEDEANSDAVEDESGNTNEDAETSSSREGSTETEDWMQSDDPASKTGDKKFTDQDIAAAKNKLRAKLDRKHESETEALKAEIERLKSGGGSEKGKTLNRPKREDFDNADDPEEAYLEALTDWKLEQNAAAAAANAAKSDASAKQEEFQRKTSEAVDQHYERAVKLAESSGISPEAYKGADLAVRQAVEAVFPNQGDATVDALILNLGEGSEKVFYNLGVNAARNAEFQKLLKEDKSGLKAAMFLGELKNKLVAPKKKTTSAPPPNTQLEGDASENGDKFKSLKRRYKEADKRGDIQARFNAKMEAKRAGVNTSDW